MRSNNLLCCLIGFWLAVFLIGCNQEGESQKSEKTQHFSEASSFNPDLLPGEWRFSGRYHGQEKITHDIDTTNRMIFFTDGRVESKNSFTASKSGTWTLEEEKQSLTIIPSDQAAHMVIQIEELSKTKLVLRQLDKEKNLPIFVHYVRVD